MFVEFLCYLVLVDFVNYGYSAPSQNKNHQIPSIKALDFMKKYGYLQMDDGHSEALYTEGGISEIIKVMQRFGGINETGVFDEATQKLITLPRCGVPDIIKSNRKRRYILGPEGWEKRNLSYFLANWSPNLGEELVQKNIQKALDVWGGYGRLQFNRKYSQDADIIVAFAQGYHGDNNPFDGPGSILAHAFFPHQQDDQGGDIHFDADENWVDKSVAGDLSEGTDFYTVALHELGHSLGLAHSPVQSSIMFPYYQDPESGVQLGYDDILAMYDMYIRRILKEDKVKALSNNDSDEYSTVTTSYDETESSSEQSTVETDPTSSSPTEYSPYSTSSATTVTDSYTDISTIYWHEQEDATVTYSGDDESVEVHKKHDQTHGIPKNNAPSFPDICDGHVDSIATLRDELFVFRDQYIWRFKDMRRLLEGYPVKLQDMFPTLPNHIKKINAAYQRPDGMIVLFTGNVFWVHDGEKFLESSPEPLTHYGLPEYLTELDAVQTWSLNRKTYFYKNDRFWRYNETSKQMDPGYPLHMQRWRGVPTYLDAATTWKDGITYFFRGGLFWKFDNNWIMVTEESPMPTPMIWFGCSENDNKIMEWFS